MKLLKVIYKNLKLLIRSKFSAFIIIFGPLLVMLLVGVSFSKQSKDYNLNLGICSQEFTPLMESFIAKLDSENYLISKYGTADECIESIKFSENHACIVFPADFSIENNKENMVVIYVDQSKINLVYLVVNTVMESFENRSSEISMELTTGILDVNEQNKQSISTIRDELDGLSSSNEEIILEAEASASDIDDLDLSYDLPSGELGTSMAEIQVEISSLEEDLEELIQESFETIDDLRDYGLNANQSRFVDDFQDEVDSINSTMQDFYVEMNLSLVEYANIVGSFEESIDDMSSKLSSAEEMSQDVSDRLETLLTEAEAVGDHAAQISSALTTMQARIEGIHVTEATSIVHPIQTKIETILKEKTNLSFLFPALIVLLLMFTGLLMPALLIIIEKNSNAAFRVEIAPTSYLVYTVANYLTALSLLLLQLTVILIVSEYYFKMQVLAVIKILLLVSLMISTLFILIGMLIGYIFNTEEMATLASVSIGSVFLLTSGLIFPLEGIPRYIIRIAGYNPFLLSSELFKKALLFNSEITSISGSIYLLVGYSVLVLVLMVLWQRIFRIRILHTKYTQMQKEKERVMSLFRVKNKPAASLEEFLLALHSMSAEDFSMLQSKREPSKWLVMVQKDKSLAREIMRAKTKEEAFELCKQRLTTEPGQEKKSKPPAGRASD